MRYPAECSANRIVGHFTVSRMLPKPHLHVRTLSKPRSLQYEYPSIIISVRDAATSIPRLTNERMDMKNLIDHQDLGSLNGMSSTERRLV